MQITTPSEWKGEEVELKLTLSDLDTLTEQFDADVTEVLSKMASGRVRQDHVAHIFTRALASGGYRKADKSPVTYEDVREEMFAHGFNGKWTRGVMVSVMDLLNASIAGPEAVRVSALHQEGDGEGND